MNLRCVVSLVFLSLALPSLAQRGGAPHAGMAAAPAAPARGGFAPPAHAGFGLPAGRSGLSSASRYGAPGGLAAGGSNLAQRNLFLPPGVTSTRPVYYSNGVRRYGEGGARGRRSTGYGPGYGLIGYGYPGYLDFGYAGELGNDAFDPLDPNNYPNGSAGISAQDAFAQAPSQSDYNYDLNSSVAYGSPQQTPPSDPDTGQPLAAAPYVPASRPKPAPLPEEDAVTIVFKDGRPSEQIHNYALTRTTLYITGAHVRAVPVEDIDLVATEKANQKAGVDFQLPTK